MPGLRDTIGVKLIDVQAGAVDIALARGSKLAQQYRSVHGGVPTSTADAAAGYAVLTVGSAVSGVLATELEVNFLRPVGGE